MRTRMLLRQVGVLCLVATAFCGMNALAEQADTFSAGPPPQGWDHLCIGNSIHVTPAANSRTYTGSGTCWVLASSGWVNANVTLLGAFRIQSNQFSEKLTFKYTSTTPTQGGGSVSIAENPQVVLSGVCGGDPWETTAQCTSSGPSIDLNKSFGWAIRLPAGPLSRNVFGAGLIQALLSNQVSKPPLSPVDLDAVRWPASDGKGAVGRVFWRVPDVSGNRWILQFEVEASMNSADSAFFKVGEVAGPGATANLSPAQISKFFWTPSKLQAADYYFRVCSVNDAGQQCSAPVKARKPTQTELMSTESHHFATAGLGGQTGSSPRPPASATGTHIALGTAIGNGGGAPNATRAPSAALGAGRGMPVIGPQKTLSAPGSRSIAAGASSAPMAGRGSPLPDLAFSFVSVQKRTYTVTGTPSSIIVEDVPAGGNAGACSQAFSFPLQLIVKNIGQANFVPKGSSSVVGVSVGSWNAAKDLETLQTGASQVMDFNVSVPPGRYSLQAKIELHNAVAESRSDNDGLSWPLQVSCDARAVAPAHLAPPASSGSSSPAGGMPAQRMLVPAVRPSVR